MKGVTSGADLFQRMMDAGYTPAKPKAPRKRAKAQTKSAADMLASIRRQNMPTERKPVDPTKRWAGVPYIVRRLRDEHSARTVDDIMAAWAVDYAPYASDPPPDEMLRSEARAAIEELRGTGDAVTA